MKIYQSPEINVEEISTTDIMQTSPNGGTVPGGNTPNPGPTGGPIMPFSTNGVTTNGGSDDNGFNFGGTFGNL